MLKYAERPPGTGLHFVDNWMSHLSIFLGYAAAGAQILLYQLGGMSMRRGAIMGGGLGVVAPLLWLTANPKTYENAGNSIQFYSGTVIEGSETIAQAGDRLYQGVLDIASGTLSKVETIRYREPLMAYTKDPVF